MDWNARLRARMAEMEITPADLARASGVNQDSIYKYVKDGVAQPRGDTIPKLAKALRVSALWLREGVDEDTVTELSQKRRRHNRSPIDSRTEPRILELDFRGGSGGGGMDTYNWNKRLDNGIVISEDAVSAEWGIPASFLRGQLRVDPKKAWIVEIYGDSMYDPANPAAPGSLFPGDRVIVDTGDIRPSPPGAFAVFDGVGLVIKLVEVLPKTEPMRIRLSSRNPSYQPYEIAEDEGRIVGRVRGRISAM